MAQLTDDCFAFSGPLLPVDDLERMISERIAPVAEIENVGARCARAAACLRADVAAPIDLPPFDNSAVDGYAVRHADLERRQPKRGSTVVDRVTAGRSARRASARAGHGDPHFHRRADAGKAPTPSSCRRMCRVEGDACIVPPGLKVGANRRLAGEDVRGGLRRVAGRARC